GVRQHLHGSRGFVGTSRLLLLSSQAERDAGGTSKPAKPIQTLGLESARTGGETQSLDPSQDDRWNLCRSRSWIRGLGPLERRCWSLGIVLGVPSQASRTCRYVRLDQIVRVYRLAKPEHGRRPHRPPERPRAWNP